MASISGVGAVILYANEPAQLAEWYRTKLGFNFQHDAKDNCHYGELADALARSSIFMAVFPAKAPLPYGNRGVMVNYKVNDFDGFLRILESKGVAIESRRGAGASRFAIISDPEGNPIELWSGA